MVKPKTCCVSGCIKLGGNEAVDLHKFPPNKILKKKWLSAFKPTRKITQTSVVCSKHFTVTDYKVVRGEKLLRMSAVPSVFDEGRGKPCSEEPAPPPTAEVPFIDGRSADGKGKEDAEEEAPFKAAEVPFIDVRTSENKITKEPFKPDDTPMDFEETIPEAKITKRIIENGPSLGDRQYFDSGDKDLKSSSDAQAAQQNGEADNLSHQQTDKQTNKQEDTSVSEDTAKDTGLDKKDTEVEVVPDYIEIAVQSRRGEAGSPDDCLMVLENVQVDLDPALLLLQLGDERDERDERDAGTVELDDDDDRPTEPVSLLTSSDESDVILEEPHIDTVEVSDETDEDDKPLTKLVPEALNRKKIRQILWGKVEELYCYCCSFVTTNSAKLKAHMATHVNGTEQQIYSCTHCIYTTPSKCQYQRHKRTHKQEKRYKCNMCSYKARHAMSLAFHMKSHEEKYACNECDYKSGDVKALQRHLRTHKQLRIKNGKKKITRQKKIASGSDTSDDEYIPDEIKKVKKVK